MDAQALADLTVHLGRRRGEVADGWYKALSSIGVAPFQTIEGHTIVVGWVDQVIELLFIDPLDRALVEGLGSTLADFCQGQPEALGQTQEILGSQLAVGLSLEDAWIVQRRVVPLLGALAVGFVRRTNARVDVRYRQAEAALVAKMAETELLRRETHHRVKNNLTVVASLLELQAAQVTDPLVRVILAEGCDRVRSMAHLHEQLYQTGELGQVDMVVYIHDLLEHLYRSYGYSQIDVKARIDADDLLLDIDLAVPLGLIINELVSNAFKHAFGERRVGAGPASNEMSISLHQNGTRLALEVRDNGVGLPEALDVEKIESFGLTLVKLLIRQIDGTLQISERKHGTAFEIVVPRPET
ncbi:MAG: sensor histidine kinase [Anaerolineae bacterium]|nr:sensor histidine kinase [Anaerolineae bacterium]